MLQLRRDAHFRVQRANFSTVMLFGRHIREMPRIDDAPGLPAMSDEEEASRG
jgi:hypothetical protein